MSVLGATFAKFPLQLDQHSFRRPMLCAGEVHEFAHLRFEYYRSRPVVGTPRSVTKRFADTVDLRCRHGGNGAPKLRGGNAPRLRCGPSSRKTLLRLAA